MMGEENKKNNNKEIPAELKNPEVFSVAPIACYGSAEEYYTMMERLYTEARNIFMTTDATDDKILKRAAEWEKISRGMIMANAELFGRKAGCLENKDKALKGLDECKKDAGIRAKNLERHFELAKKDENKNEDDLQKLRMNLAACLMFLFRVQNTQRKYLKLYVSSPDYVTPEYRIEKEQSAIVAKGMKMIPRGHFFLPARPFPPARIPEGDRVPYLPDAYDAWKSLPIEDFYFDTETDEFALPKGYVSKDGTIDDESVVWNWKDNTVTMKFRGGEPITWPFWKPKDTYDTLKKGEWVTEYYQRLYRQLLADADPPGLNEV